MFVRFRETCCRLQCSLIETRRVNGKVRHEHIASLGAVPVSPSIADRIAFWAALHQRLGRLSNRVDAETWSKVIGQVHARIAMPSADEQRQLQKDNAEADERFWSGLRDMHTSTVEEHKELISAAQHAVAKGETAASNAASKADRAREQLTKIEQGEDVAGGLGKPVDIEALMLANGFTKRDLLNMRRLDTLLTELESRGIASDYWEALHRRREAAKRRIERQAERDVLRKHGLQWDD
jgi:hypothetical protein